MAPLPVRTVFRKTCVPFSANTSPRRKRLGATRVFVSVLLVSDDDVILAPTTTTTTTRLRALCVLSAPPRPQVVGAAVALGRSAGAQRYRLTSWCARACRRRLAAYSAAPAFVYLCVCGAPDACIFMLSLRITTGTRTGPSWTVHVRRPLSSRLPVIECDAAASHRCGLSFGLRRKRIPLRAAAPDKSIRLLADKVSRRTLIGRTRFGLCVAQ